MKTVIVAIALATGAVGASAQSSQPASTHGAFIMSVDHDTIVVERFSRSGDSIVGTLSREGAPDQRYTAVLGADFVIRSLALDVAAQQIVITMRDDSALVNIGGAVRRFGTAPGAVALLNNSFALAEQLTRRARRLGGTAQIPAWAITGGATLTVSVRPVGTDSMVLTIVGAPEERLAVDRSGAILGGTIPSQRIILARTADRRGLAPRRPTDSATPPAGVVERAIIVPGPVPLGGTLTLPPGRGPFPGVVLVHGSGSGDRDETLLGNTPFRDIAWQLAQRGVAVLRYDKRSHVAPMWFAEHPFTVFDETIQDALSALTLLRAEPEIDAQRSFVAGHSLGGMLAPRIAKLDDRLAGVIIMAGASEIKLPAQMDRQYAYLQSISGADTASIVALRAQLAPSLARIRSLRPADTADTKPIPGLGGTGTRYWLDLDAYDPALTMREVHKPVLVLQGMRDYQVPPDQLDAWLKVLGPRNDLTVRRYPALTHLFIAGSGVPRPDEYGIPGHVDPAVAADIAVWIHALGAAQP